MPQTLNNNINKWVIIQKNLEKIKLNFGSIILK